MEEKNTNVPVEYFRVTTLKRKDLLIPPVKLPETEEEAGGGKYPLFRELFKEVVPEVMIHRHGYDHAGIEKINYRDDGQLKIAELHTANDCIAVIKKNQDSNRKIYTYDGPGGFVVWFLSGNKEVKYIFTSGSSGQFDDVQVEVFDFKSGEEDKNSYANLISTFKNEAPEEIDRQTYIKKAVIMATGAGHLTSPISGNLSGKSKFAIPIAGKPLIQYSIDILSQHNIKNIMINTHTLPHSVETAIGQGMVDSVEINYSYESELQGTAISIAKNKSYLGNEDFIVMQGDVISSFNVSRLIKNHESSKAAATVSLYPYMINPRFGYAAIDHSGQVIQLTTDQSKITKNMVPVVGFVIFSPKIWKYIEKAEKKVTKGQEKTIDLEFDILFEMIRANENVRGEFIGGYWHFLDNIRKYCDLSTLLMAQQNGQLDGKYVNQPIYWPGCFELREENAQVKGNVIIIQ